MQFDRDLHLIWNRVGSASIQVRPTELRVRSTDLLPRHFLPLFGSAGYRLRLTEPVGRSIDLVPKHFQPLVRSTDSGSPVDRPAAICQLCLFCLVVWISNFNRFVLFPFCCYHLLLTLMTCFLWEFLEYPFWWIRYRFLWIFIHVFECEFKGLIVPTIFFVICHFKNIKVFYTSSKYQNSFFKWFQHYFITKLVFLNRFPIY